MSRSRRTNPSSLFVAGGVSAFLAVAVGAWAFARKAALAQAAAEAEAAKQERLVAPIKGFTPQRVGVRTLAQSGSSGIRPFQNKASGTTATTPPAGTAPAEDEAEAV